MNITEKDIQDFKRRFWVEHEMELQGLEYMVYYAVDKLC